MPDTWHLQVGWSVAVLIFCNANVGLGPFVASLVLLAAWVADLLLFPNYGDRL